MADYFFKKKMDRIDGSTSNHVRLYLTEESILTSKNRIRAYEDLCLKP
jgi:hypothetical protein